MTKNNNPRFCTPEPINLSRFFNCEGLSVWMGPVDRLGNSGKMDFDFRLEGLKSIDLSKCVFDTFRGEKDKSTTCEEILERLKREKPEFVRFGVGVFHGLWLDYQAAVEKEDSSLEWLFKIRGVDSMNFMGTILRYRGDFHRRTIYLSRNYEGKWDWGWGYLHGRLDIPIIGCVENSGAISR